MSLLAMHSKHDFSETTDTSQGSRFSLFSYIESFAFHLLIFLPLLFVMLVNPKEGSHETASTIQFEPVQQKNLGHGKRARSKNSVVPYTRSKPNPHGISLSDLGLKLNTAPLAPSTPESFYSSSSDQAASDTSSSAADQAASDTSSSAIDAWDLKNPDPRIARFNEYVYRTVQGWLDRDASLNTERIYGTVKVKIWFNEKGEYLEDETVYEAIDPQFQSIVARALRKSFSNPIPRPFLFMQKKFSIERMVVIRAT